MLDFTEARLELASLHFIGNKSRGEGTIFSAELLDFDKNLEKALLKFALTPFALKNKIYSFSHNDDTKFNEVKSYSESILENNDLFLDKSIKIASHLYSVGNHPNIKTGELIVGLFSGITFNKKKVFCLGIFKSETKDYFLTYPHKSNNNISAKLEKGVGLNNLDKGALVLKHTINSDLELLVFDKISADAQYWLNSFLDVQIKQDNRHFTEIFMKSCLSFSKSSVANNFEKKDLIYLNNYVSDYFTETSFFNYSDFFKGIENEEYAEYFLNHVSRKTSDANIDLKSSFSIDRNKVERITRKIKNIIKLDTNIELKIGKIENNISDNIEKGFDDEKEMYYYKIYFNEELN
jgi:hypothetical protein